MPSTDLLRSMRAVRRFKPGPLPEEILADILDVGRWSGSSKNTQPWDLIVVEDRDRLRDLARLGPYADHVAGAAAAIVLVMHGDDVKTGFDEGRLAERIMLAAWAHGVGSCIGSIYLDDNEARAKELLGIPAALYCRTVLSLGIPADASATRLPPSSRVPRGRRPLSEMVSWETFGAGRKGAPAKRG